MESTHARAPSLGHTEINWDKLDKTKFYVIGAGLFTGITVALYPVSLVKTRMQVASKEIAEKNAFSIVKNILRTDGIPGLYRGFGTVMTGAIPARIIFLTGLETAKVASFNLIEPFKFSEPVKAAIANGMAGLSASLASQAFFVPLDVESAWKSMNQLRYADVLMGFLTCKTDICALTDNRIYNSIKTFQSFLLYLVLLKIFFFIFPYVYHGFDVVEVSQKLMVQGYSGNTTYSGGFDAARQIIKGSGIRGLYRGFGLSVMTYSPSSAVWWASYGSSQRIIWKLLDGENNGSTAIHSQWTMPLAQATGGLFAGAVSSFVTTPLDTIKTRLQVIDSRNRESAGSAVKSLVVEEGWKGLYRGLSPRFISMSAWGTSMILAYEYLKRLCFQGGETV